MQKILFSLAVGLCSVFGVLAQTGGNPTQGTLTAFSAKGLSIGACPLKHTDVRVEISGFLARARVTQEFENNFNQPIEAVYRFPLPENSAVDDMRMTIGARIIRAEIKTRDEAREIYETAKADGKTTALLDQELPNIFTQQVANILPNETITVEISFVQTLRYEDGEYEFVFPMTVGERYVPASMSAANASLVTPNIARVRAGHDISIEVNLDAGVPVEAIRSTSHAIETINLSPSSASVKLKGGNVIPNKDFILRYDVTGKRIEDAILTHRDERGGFFTLILSPPEKFAAEDIKPKEIVFVLDTSGSMEGFPIEKAKEAMKMSLAGLNPQDTFNLITFAGDTHVLFKSPVPATPGNLAKAQAFLRTRGGSGGTEMMKAIKTALAPSNSQDHIRIVCFMTDGYVGNDMEIIGEVQKYPNARVFSFGVGSSVNRFLLDKMAEAGRGEVEYVGPDDDGSKAARRFYERVRTPLLTDVSIDWNGLAVADVYPRRLPDLFSAKPAIIYGRYQKAGRGTIRLKGNVAGQELIREINVDFPETETKNDVLATLWARTKIDDLMARDWQGVQDGNAPKELEENIIRLGLDFRLLTQYTSFVAVEETIRTQAGRPVKVEVPSENPEGVRTEIIQNITESPAVAATPAPTGQPRLVTKMGNVDFNAASIPVYMGGAPSARTVSKTISGGVINGKALVLPAPILPTASKGTGVSGSVNVQVLIDESGNVISSSAVSGHPLLRAASEAAARRSRFVPTMMSGRPIRVSGVITYNFAQGQTIVANAITADSVEAEPPPLTDEMKRQKMLEEKLDPRLLAIVEALRTRNSDSVTAEFIDGGKALVEIQLTKITADVREKLARLGFVSIDESQTAVIVGQIAPEKLAALAGIIEIRYIRPKVE